VLAHGFSLGHCEALNLLKHNPSDSFSAWGHCERTFVGPVSASSHRLKESGHVNVLDVPFSSSLELGGGLFLARNIVELERFKESVSHSTTAGSIEEDGDSGNFVFRSTSLLFKHKLDLRIISESIDSVLRG